MWITVLQGHEDVMLNSYECWKLSGLRGLDDKTLEEKLAGKKEGEGQKKAINQPTKNLKRHTHKVKCSSQNEINIKWEQYQARTALYTKD